MAHIFSHPKDLLTAIGMKLTSSEWLEIDQNRIQLFADATDDQQWIHIDPERASSGPFGACIAHGYLTLSLVNKFLPQLMKVEQTTMGVNYGCNKVRFPNSVKVNQRIRANGEITEVVEYPNAVQMVVNVVVEIEGEDKPACVADTISRFYYS